MKLNKHTMTDNQLDELLAQTHKRQWTGPDHSPKVDQYLNHSTKGPKMKSHPNRLLSHSALILLGVGALAGGSLATVVTHTIMSRHATIITQDGNKYDVELLETPDGAASTFVAEDGTTFDINVVGQDAQQVTVDVNSPNGGVSTIILEDGVAPSVLTEPGQTASIKIDSSNDEKHSESDD